MKIKDTFIKYFPDRDSQTISSPFENNKNINKGSIKNLMIDEFVSNFQKDVEDLKRKIFRDINGKKIKGKKLNGFTIANFIEGYLEAINQSKKPDMDLM
jgi:hypothetical protein